MPRCRSCEKLPLLFLTWSGRTLSSMVPVISLGSLLFLFSLRWSSAPPLPPAARLEHCLLFHLIDSTPTRMVLSLLWLSAFALGHYLCLARQDSATRLYGLFVIEAVRLPRDGQVITSSI